MKSLHIYDFALLFTLAALRAPSSCAARRELYSCGRPTGSDAMKVVRTSSRVAAFQQRSYFTMINDFHALDLLSPQIPQNQSKKFRMGAPTLRPPRQNRLCLQSYSQLLPKSTKFCYFTPTFTQNTHKIKFKIQTQNFRRGPLRQNRLHPPSSF